MKIEDIEDYDKYIYTESCGCGEKITVLTQRDVSPEYYTNVYVLCSCGDYVYFDLPVN